MVAGDFPFGFTKWAWESGRSSAVNGVRVPAAVSGRGFLSTNTKGAPYSNLGIMHFLKSLSFHP